MLVLDLETGEDVVLVFGFDFGSTGIVGSGLSLCA